MSKELAAGEIAASQRTEEGVAASLGLNAQLFVFQFVNFAIVGAVLWFLVLRPLVKKMEERRTLVNDSLDKAKEAETALAMSEVKFQERIDDAKMEANKLIERAQGDAEAIAADMKVKAKREIQLLVDQAKRNIQIERDEAMDAVRGESADLIAAAVKKILGENFDEKKDRKWMEDALKNI
jgi:F-type H+-transporting ATPase subunit b